METLPIVPRWKHAPINNAKMVLTQDLLRVIASRLTGRPMTISNSKVLALVAGGVVIGLCGNEAQGISRDTGHCLYIAPSSIATPERRIKEMFQPSVLSGSGKFDSCTDLNDVEEPSDGFGEVIYGHVVQIRGDSAEVTSVISCGSKTLHIDILKAIDLAGDILRWEDYLGDCARGRLKADDLEKVRVVDRTNYGDYLPLQMNRTSHKKPRLTVVLADRNDLVQRAVVSHMKASEVCILQLGSSKFPLLYISTLFIINYISVNDNAKIRGNLASLLNLVHL